MSSWSVLNAQKKGWLASWKAGAGHLSLRDCQPGRGQAGPVFLHRGAGWMSTAVLLNISSRAFHPFATSRRSEIVGSPLLSTGQLSTSRSVKLEEWGGILSCFRPDGKEKNKEKNKENCISTRRTVVVSRNDDRFHRENRGVLLESSWSWTRSTAMVVDIFKTDSKANWHENTVMSDKGNGATKAIPRGGWSCRTMTSTSTLRRRINKSLVASDMRRRDASNAPALGVVRRCCCLAAATRQSRDTWIHRILCTYRIP